MSHRRTLIKIAFLTGGAKSLSLGQKAVRAIDTVLELPGRGLAKVTAPVTGGVVGAPFKGAKSLGRSAIGFAKKHPFLSGTAALGAIYGTDSLVGMLSPQALGKIALEPLAPSALIKPTAEIEAMAARDAAQQPSQYFLRFQDPRFPATSKLQWGVPMSQRTAPELYNMSPQQQRAFAQAQRYQ